MALAAITAAAHLRTALGEHDLTNSSGLTDPDARWPPDQRVGSGFGWHDPGRDESREEQSDPRPIGRGSLRERRGRAYRKRAVLVSSAPRAETRGSVDRCRRRRVEL